MPLDQDMEGSPQTCWRNSAFVTRRPVCATRERNTANGRGRKASRTSPRHKPPGGGSRRKPSKVCAGLGSMAPSVKAMVNALGHCGGWVLGSDGTRNRCKPALTFAELLLSAKKGRLWRNGHMFVRKSLLQKPKLSRQLLQSPVGNLLSRMLLWLNRVFCSNPP